MLPLPDLRLDSAGRAHLRARRRDASDSADPTRRGAAEQVAAEARAAGAAVVALTERDDVSGFVPLARAAAEIGLYALPGVTLSTRGEDVHAWLFDPQNEELLELLAATRAGTVPAVEAAAEAVQRAGGVALAGEPPWERIEGPGGVRVEPLRAVADLLRWLPLHSVHRNYFIRFARDVASLDETQFAQCLAPATMRLAELEFGTLIETAQAPVPREPRGQRSRAGFLLIGPGSRHGARRIQIALRERGIRTLAVDVVDRWREFVASLLAGEGRSPAARALAMLRLNLEKSLFGEAGDRGLVVAYERGPHTAALDSRLPRTRWNGLRFHRVRWEGMVEHLETPELRCLDEAPYWLLDALAERGIEWAYEHVPRRVAHR